MKVVWLCCALLLLGIVNCREVRCQNQPKLALDNTKPFVYLKFDHSGPRQPQEPDELSQGLWLRLVNNSVLPIFMRVHSSLTDPAITILEDIVTPRIRTIPKTGFVDYGPMPHGYATAADVTSILTLKPGESVLFSVPVNQSGTEALFKAIRATIATKYVSIGMVVAALIGGGFALAANLVAFTMIQQINLKVPEEQKVDWFFWGTEIKKKHHVLYPDSKLVSALNSLTWMMVASFLVLCWFVLH